MKNFNWIHVGPSSRFVAEWKREAVKQSQRNKHGEHMTAEKRPSPSIYPSVSSSGKTVKKEATRFIDSNFSLSFIVEQSVWLGISPSSTNWKGVTAQLKWSWIDEKVFLVECADAFPTFSHPPSAPHTHNPSQFERHYRSAQQNRNWISLQMNFVNCYENLGNLAMLSGWGEWRKSQAIT